MSSATRAFGMLRRRTTGGASSASRRREGGERQPFAAPVQDAVPGRLLPPGPYPQHGLVAEAGQLVVGAAVLEMDLDAAELRQPLPQGGEEGGIDRPARFSSMWRACTFWRSRERGVAGSAWHSSTRGVERFEERQAAHVAQEDARRRDAPADGALQHLGEIVGAREVLRHRVDDHGVEGRRPRSRRARAPRLAQQPDAAVVQPHAAELALDVAEGAAGEVDAGSTRSQRGATRKRIRPVPQPISSTRRGSQRERSRATVSSSHSRISLAGIGRPV